MLYRVTVWAHVNIQDEAQESEFIIHAASFDAAMDRAERGKYDLCRALGWVDARVERVQELVCRCPPPNSPPPERGMFEAAGSRMLFCPVHGTVPIRTRPNRREQDLELAKARFLMRGDE